MTAAASNGPQTDPFVRFAHWYAEAQTCGLTEPTHVHLSTCDADGQPSGRIVLLKSFDAAGFVFYTNEESRKGRELRQNPRAALCFYWGPLERQVRVAGRVEPVAPKEADAYFATRPRGSQLGAWASLQSAPLATRAALVERVQEVEARYAGAAVPRPPHWGGFRVVPHELEFWQGMPSRLHEREVFRLEAGHWQHTLLYP